LAADDDNDEDNDRMVLLAASIYAIKPVYAIQWHNNVTIWDFFDPWIVRDWGSKQTAAHGNNYY